MSVAELPDGRWRVRWRETVDDGDGPRRVQRERVVRDERTARGLQGKILRALEQGEVVELEPVRQVTRVATLDEVLAGWLRSRKAKGLSRGTILENGDVIRRILRTFRRIERLGDADPVPGTVLHRGRLDEFTLRLRAPEGTRKRGLSDATVYNTARVLLAAWTWAGDDPDTYPGLAAAPRDKGAVLPRPAMYSAPPAATMAELDAILRILADRRHGTVALHVSVIGRCTGLRVAQALALHVGEVHLEDCALTISSGKTRREKAERRVVPMAPVLRDYLAPLVLGRAPEETVIRRRSDLTRNRNGPSRTLANAWDEATRKGLARVETWAPADRAFRRPDHAFRAAFQAHLVGQGVRDETIDALVGHAGKTTRDRHYAGPAARWSAMVEAVGKIPAIQWTQPAPPTLEELAEKWGQGAEGAEGAEA